MWNDFSKSYSVAAKLLPASNTNMNAEASIYGSDMKIHGEISISYDTSTKVVSGLF